MLKQHIERIERSEEEKAGLADDIGDVYTKAKYAHLCLQTNAAMPFPLLMA